MSIEEVFEAIRKERAYQRSKYGPDKQQSLPGFITILHREVREAEDAWCKDISGSRATPLEEILHVAAVAVAALEKYGVEGTARSTDDISEERMREERALASERRFGVR